jgi:hypothetical protein
MPLTLEQTEQHNGLGQVKLPHWGHLWLLDNRIAEMDLFNLCSSIVVICCEVALLIDSFFLHVLPSESQLY